MHLLTPNTSTNTNTNTSTNTNTNTSTNTSTSTKIMHVHPWRSMIGIVRDDVRRVVLCDL